MILASARWRHSNCDVLSDAMGYPLGMESDDIMDGQMWSTKSGADDRPWRARYNLKTYMDDLWPWFEISPASNWWQVCC